MTATTKTRREKVDERTREVVKEVAGLARDYADVAEREAAAAGARAIWPAAALAGGGFFFIAGVMALAIAPAVPPYQRTFKRRLRGTGAFYATSGVLGLAAGILGLGATARTALPRTRHRLVELARDVRRALSQPEQRRRPPRSDASATP